MQRGGEKYTDLGASSKLKENEDLIKAITQNEQSSSTSDVKNDEKKAEIFLYLNHTIDNWSPYLHSVDIKWKYFSPESFTEGDRIRIYDSQDKLLQEATIGAIEGILQIKEKVLIGEDEVIGVEKTYLKANLFNSSEIIASCQLKTRHNWMHMAKDTIGKVGFEKLLLPGAHNACTYRSQWSIVPRGLYKCQNLSIGMQMNFGCRVFDVRMRNNGPDLSFVTNHGCVDCYNVIHVFSEIKKFVQATKEVIFIDVHEVRDFSSSEKYDQLFMLLESILDDYLADCQQVFCLNDAWNSNKRIILSFESKILRQPKYTFNPVPHLWGNKAECTDVIEYLETHLKSYEGRTKMFVACAQVTRNLLHPKHIVSIMANPGKGLGHYGYEMGSILGKFLRKNSKRLNIVYVDYVMGSEFLELMILLSQNQ